MFLKNDIKKQTFTSALEPWDRVIDQGYKYELLESSCQEFCNTT